MNTLKVNDGNQRKWWEKLKMENHIWGKWEWKKLPFTRKKEKKRFKEKLL